MDRQQREHDNYAEAAKRAGKASNYYYKQYGTQSLKGIAESKTKQAKNWISSRPQAIKKKVSEITNKIADAQKGKQTIHSVGSGSKKKSGRMHAETVFPSKSQNPKKYKEQTNRYKNSTTKKSTGRKTVTDYGVSGTFRTYYKRK